jgi:hypothetical protein
MSLIMEPRTCSTVHYYLLTIVEIEGLFRRDACTTAVVVTTSQYDSLLLMLMNVHISGNATDLKRLYVAYAE